MKRLVILVALVSILGGFTSFAQVNPSGLPSLGVFFWCKDSCSGDIFCTATCWGDKIAPVIGRTAVFSNVAIREAGKPTIYTWNFTANPTGEFWLHIINGDPETGFDKISAATISLNGEIIVNNNNFNQIEDFLEPIKVQLETGNKLEVTLNSAPKSYIYIFIHDQKIW